MSARGFEHIPHTADVKIRAWGPDLSIALAEAVRGFTGLVTDVMLLEPDTSRSITITAPTKDALLFDLIADLVYRKDVESFLASDVHFRVWHEKQAWHLTGTLKGLCLIGRELSDVKAMTYHDMRIDEEPHKTTITYVLDL